MSQSESGGTTSTTPPEGATPPVTTPPLSGDGKSGDGATPPAQQAGDDWESKFTAQRTVNRDLESKLNQLRDGLKSALGIEDKKADTDTILSGLQQQLASLQHDSLVAAVARANGITDDDDIEILRSAKDQDAMNRLAGRLKPTAATAAATATQPPRGPVIPGHTPAGAAPQKPGDGGRAAVERRFGKKPA